LHYRRKSVVKIHNIFFISTKCPEKYIKRIYGLWVFLVIEASSKKGAADVDGGGVCDAGCQFVVG